VEIPVLQATQPKGEKFSLKEWCRNMPFKEASMQHPTSCGQNILDTQVNGSYTASNEKQVLIKQTNQTTGQPVPTPNRLLQGFREQTR